MIDREEDMRWLLEARSGGLSEVTGRMGEVRHHILGRNKPRAFKGLPDVLKEWWPHVPMNCILLTVGEHYTGHGRSETVKSPTMMKHLLLTWLLHKYGDRIWEGKTYKEWLNEPPFKEFL